MSIQRSEAIVLKSQKLGETSKIIIVFTKKYGKIKVVAKGARGIKSHFYGALEPANYISLIFYHKENRDLQLISQADIIESYDGMKSDLEKLSLAFIACEIILRSQYDNEPNPNLFNLAIAFFRKLNEGKRNIENYLFWFQLKFLKNSGIKPNFSECIKCKKNIQEFDQLVFSIPQGGCICEDCNYATGADSIKISNNSLTYLNAMEKHDLEQIHETAVSTKTIQESSLLVNKFMAFHIENLNHLRTMNFLHDIQLRGNGNGK
jgi:DNA repair protein RecO (recombination protein O)